MNFIHKNNNDNIWWLENRYWGVEKGKESENDIEIDGKKS